MDEGLARHIGVSNFSLAQVGPGSCQQCCCAGSWRLVTLGVCAAVPSFKITTPATAAVLGAVVDIGRTRCCAIPPTHHGSHVRPADQAQVEDLASWARIQPVCNQVELHPMLAQRRLVEGCRRLVSGGRHGILPLGGHGMPGTVQHASLHG